GQGNTPKLREKNYSIEEMADFLYQFLQALKIKQVVIVGNSMGGHIATVFTLKYPRMVSYLILISPSGIDNGKEKPYLTISLENFQDEDKIKSLEWNNKIREDIRNNSYYLLNPFLNKIIQYNLEIYKGGSKNDRR
ncbi:MAG: alpha/beta fold hydrolase, partial [bacterium]